MCKRILSLALMVVALPLIGAAPTIDATTHPIRINACGPQLGSQTQNLFGVPVASTSNGMQIQFTNESSKAANLVNFAVDSNGQEFVIRDVGTFSPGIEITHRYRNGAGQSFVLPGFISPKVKCHVDSVRFTDGTVWRRGDKHHKADAVPSTLSVAPAGPVNLAVNGEARLFMVQSTGTVAAFSERDACSGIAKITLAAAGENSATYSVMPVQHGSCTAKITEESGAVATVAINVQ